MDNIVDPGRKERSGPKGYRPSSIFMALLLMYLQGFRVLNFKQVGYNTQSNTVYLKGVT